MVNDCLVLKKVLNFGVFKFRNENNETIYTMEEELTESLKYGFMALVEKELNDLEKIELFPMLWFKNHKEFEIRSKKKDYTSRVNSSLNNVIQQFKMIKPVEAIGNNLYEHETYPNEAGEKAVCFNKDMVGFITLNLAKNLVATKENEEKISFKMADNGTYIFPLSTVEYTVNPETAKCDYCCVAAMSIKKEKDSDEGYMYVYVFHLETREELTDEDEKRLDEKFEQVKEENLKVAEKFYNDMNEEIKSQGHRL